MQSQLFVPSYLKNTYQYELKTKIQQLKDDKIIFEDTIFHPQGGGQPKDKGWVEIGGIKRQILDAIPDKSTGKISYQLNNSQGLTIGQDVLMTIDEQIRIKNAKLHSAGHILDLAVQRLGIAWEGTKGYHFQDGPYVQYKGTPEKLQQKTKLINEELKKIIQLGIPTTKQHYSYEQAVKKQIVPKQFKAALIRIVKYGDSSCPCGGTHIDNTKQVKKVEVTKILKKGKFLRVSYLVE